MSWSLACSFNAQAWGHLLSTIGLILKHFLQSHSKDFGNPKGEFNRRHAFSFLKSYNCLPGAASCYPWAGVAGLYRLFGREALSQIGECEKERVDGIIGDFVSPNGAVIAFHKEAYQVIKSSESSDYTLAKAKAGHSIGNCQCDPGVTLFCLPPTRLLPGYPGLLRNFRDCIPSN